MSEKDPDFIPSNSSDISDVEITEISPSHTQSSTPITSTTVASRQKKTPKKGLENVVSMESECRILPKPKIQFIEMTPTALPVTSSQSSTITTIASMKLSTPVNVSSKKSIKLFLDEEKNKNASIPNCKLVINSGVLQNLLDTLSVCSFVEEVT